MLDDMILTAGPSITNLEIEYVTDACATGWNSNWAGYLNKFQNCVADYVGQKYALATSSCTGAMHLAVSALGIGPGDEVIVPEITWVATASAVAYLGAKPVFCDVDMDTWCMNVDSLSAKITPRTKAIIPVHIYGHPCDMDPILEIARKHNLYILEDAAQSMGSLYQGRHTASFGHFAAFSFQGAKAIVTGEGGMLLSSDKELFDKATVIGDHGRSTTIPLFNEFIGQKYKMSNLQAALGYAQMQRVEEIVDRKREIFDWYQKRLGGVSEIALNVERPGCKNIFWMTTIVFKDANADRDEFMRRLKANGVDCRPVFYPLSSMPMFSGADNPNAYHVGLKGINLPSGHERTEEEIDYICKVIKALLAPGGKEVVDVRPSGWLAYKAEVLSKIAYAKRKGTRIPFTLNGEEFALVSVTDASINNPEHTALMTAWRKSNQHAFLESFNVTEEGTGRWLENMQTKQRERLLFFVEKDGELLGHIGLDRFDFQKRECMLDNVIMAPQNLRRGLGRAAGEALYAWAKQELGMTRIFCLVVGSNTGARNFYLATGFTEVNQTPLRKEITRDGFKLRPIYVLGGQRPDDSFVYYERPLN